LISVILSIVYMKDHPKKHNDEDSKDHANPSVKKHTSFVQSVQRTLSFLRHPIIGPLLFIKFLNGISSSAFTTILPLILANKLQFSTTQMGYFMSTSSLSVAAFAAVGIAPAMSSVGNRADRLAFVGIGCRLASVVVLGVIVSWVVSGGRRQ